MIVNYNNFELIIRTTIDVGSFNLSSRAMKSIIHFIIVDFVPFVKGIRKYFDIHMIAIVHFQRNEHNLSLRYFYLKFLLLILIPIPLVLLA